MEHVLLLYIGSSDMKIIFMVFCLLIILSVFLFVVANRPIVVLSHWHHSFDYVPYSPSEVYEMIINTVTEKNVPGVSFRSLTLTQKGLLSERREYLRIRINNYIFDVCAAPFAKGFFVSWRMLEQKTFTSEMLRKHPALIHFAEYKTYYQQDTEIMVKEYIHKGIMEAINEMAASKGMRALSETERAYKDIGK